MNDLILARAVIFEELKTNLMFWKCFPWRLAALAHCNEQKGRDSAKAIVKHWAAMDQTREKHHLLTLRLSSLVKSLLIYICQWCGKGIFEFVVRVVL